MADRLGFWELSFQVVIPQLLVAVRWTLALTACAAVLGTAIGLVIALMRISRSRLLRALATGYVTLIRGHAPDAAAPVHLLRAAADRPAAHL
ncbi:MAG: hypothetical protein DIU70_000335 [Bacillota bacterium]